jgi:hypothetical protein
MSIKDTLHDVVEHTFKLGNIDLVKVTGTDKDTNLESLAEDKTVVVQASFKSPVAEFIGVFGMPNLGKLNTLLNLEVYREGANISVTSKTQNDQVVLDGIHFENKDKDFKNDYRFMSTALVNDKLKKVTFKEPSWDLEFEPTIAGIQRLKMQASANSEEPLFTAKTEKNDLKFFFGDHSTHAGNFVFHPGCGDKINRAWSFPAKQVISILDLVGDKKFYIANAGAAMITVDSGIAVYKYILPAQTK